jgi:hypothetical protein
VLLTEEQIRRATAGEGIRASESPPRRRSPMRKLAIASIAVALIGVVGTVTLFWGRTNDGR